MSDDASGPEDESESRVRWIRRMARVAGLDERRMSDQEASELQIYENIRPNWRSEAVRCLDAL